jgi:hypothetical protein
VLGDPIFPDRVHALPPERAGDGLRKAVKDRQLTLEELVKAIPEFRKFTDQSLRLRDGDYAQAG